MSSARSNDPRERRPPGEVLVGPEWLAAHLGDPGLRVIEVDVSPAAFTVGHIDGAILWNVYRDLKDTEYHTLDGSAIEELLRSSGIDQKSTVVFYGYAPVLGFWLLKLYGHQDVRILDGGRQAWLDAGLPSTTSVREWARTQYPLPGQLAPIRADQSRVLSVIGRSGSTILDVRTDLEFRGERFWPSGGQEPDGRAGHIPSAMHICSDEILDEEGRFRSELELRAIFQSIDGTDSDVITYCTIGGRASTAWFALTYLLGRDNVRVYDGSWAEWGRLPTLPVANEIRTTAAGSDN